MKLDIDSSTLLFKNKEGLLHRECGPAVIYASGLSFYWLNGKHIKTEEEFKILTSELGKILYL